MVRVYTRRSDAFADHAAINVDEILEAAVDEHESQKYAAQQQQKRNLPELVAEYRPREIASPDRFVDDGLRQVQRHIEKGKRQHRKCQQQNLLSTAVLQHEAKDSRFHSGLPCLWRY